MTLKYKNALAEKIQNNRQTLWDWHLERVQEAPPPRSTARSICATPDHKIVPVDSNLYPAGFNNICPEDLRAAPPSFRAQIEAVLTPNASTPPSASSIIPESHTSNRFYIENLYYLTQIIPKRASRSRIGWYGPIPEGQPAQLGRTASPQTGKEHRRPIRSRSKPAALSAGDFIPDLDRCSTTTSRAATRDRSTPSRSRSCPSHTLGWHYAQEERALHPLQRAWPAEFAAIIGIDPWLIPIDTEEVAPVNFNEDQWASSEVAEAVERILAAHARGLRDAQGEAASPSSS